MGQGIDLPTHGHAEHHGRHGRAKACAQKEKKVTIAEQCQGVGSIQFGHLESFVGGYLKVKGGRRPAPAQPWLQLANHLRMTWQMVRRLASSIT